jgi:hypothetical protein
LINYFVKVSARIRDLIVAIRKLDYGELHDVEITDGGDQITEEVDAQTRRLVDVLEDNTYLSSIRVRGGSPVVAETPFEYKGFKGTKTIKLD